jgi:hypothetical protein
MYLIAPIATTMAAILQFLLVCKWNKMNRIQKVALLTTFTATFVIAFGLIAS